MSAYPRSFAAAAAGPWLTPMLMALLMLAAQAGGEPVRAALRYERSAVLAGQFWRLLTAHVVHLGWVHLLLNLAALGLCVSLARGRMSGRFWLAATVALALGVGVLLLLASPELANYVGFSGVVYGLLVCVLGPQAWRGERFALGLLLLVLARVAWQVWADAAGGQGDLIGGVVVAQAHMYGAACGLLLVIAWGLLKRHRPVDHRT